MKKDSGDGEELIGNLVCVEVSNGEGGITSEFCPRLAFSKIGVVFLSIWASQKENWEKVYFLFLFCTRDYYPSGHRTENITYTNNVKKHNKGIFFSSPLSGLMNLEEHWIKSQRPKLLVLLCP